jgi:hypothetical protein
LGDIERGPTTPRLTTEDIMQQRPRHKTRTVVLQKARSPCKTKFSLTLAD